jgi:hypothetical protein
MSIPNLQFNEGLPTADFIKEYADPQVHKCLIIDDLMIQMNESLVISDLFTKGSHHLNLTIIVLTQSLFSKGKVSRVLRLNTHYYILFRNLSDNLQIVDLGKRLYPGKSHVLKQIYADATSIPYSYLLLDLSPHSNDLYRIRSKILPDENTLIYQL